MFEDLRAQLSERDLVPGAVVLPGDEGVPLEGALHVQPVEGDQFRLETVDYGVGAPLGRAEGESAAAELLLNYLDQPLPPVRTVAGGSLDIAGMASALPFADLMQRAQEEPLLIEVPQGVPLDRIGVLDGVMLYPIGTSFEARSLPPATMQPGSRLFQFVTQRSILMRVEIAQPWFGRPGGGLRCTIAQDFVGIRDLVAIGALEQVQVDE